ncbi:MAG: TIGR04290 family methyltransferase [Phycisphaerae bacterium]|nr:TIGR04290 family methyltransferase [Phycisphaerae bacterium]
MTTFTNTTEPFKEIHSQVEALGPWFHNLHLPDGTQTAPQSPFGDFPACKWAEVGPHLPHDLSEWTVLDIGCNAGYYSFELAKRGACVTAIDFDPHYLAQARWACRQFGLEDRIEFKQMQVYDLAHAPESYDLILFLGVFYHLRHPLLALDIVAQRVNRLLVFQTLTMPGLEVYTNTDNWPIEHRDPMTEPGWPKMAFIEHRLAGDPTNWWAPNHACCEAMLRSSGLTVIARPGHEIYLCKPADDYRRDESNPTLIELLSATGQSKRPAWPGSP